MLALRGLTSLTADEKVLLARVKQAILIIFPSALAYVYGSAARRTQGPESDYDILVLTDSPLNVHQQSTVRDALLEIEIETGAVICFMFYSKMEWQSPDMCITPFHFEVEKDAIPL